MAFTEAELSSHVTHLMRLVRRQLDVYSQRDITSLVVCRSHSYNVLLRLTSSKSKQYRMTINAKVIFRLDNMLAILFFSHIKCTCKSGFFSA